MNGDGVFQIFLTMNGFDTTMSLKTSRVLIDATRIMIMSLIKAASSTGKLNLFFLLKCCMNGCK